MSDSAISTDRLGLWMCVRARVLTPRLEDEIWTITHQNLFFGCL